MKPVRVENPPNPFSSMLVEYLEEPPEIGLEVYEDHSRSILAENDSPDVGFRFSVNPYRGCFHACAYCLHGETPILMADGSTKPMADLRVGDAIYGTRSEGRYRRYVKTRVLAHWSVVKPAYRVTLRDGTTLVASADHRFLTRRGWKHVTGSEHGRARRPHLTLNDKLLGTGRVAEAPSKSVDYVAGYLCGLIRGDGMIGTYDYSGKRRAKDIQHHFRLALIDNEALDRARQYLLESGVATHAFVFQAAAPAFREMAAIRTHARREVDRIREVIRFPDIESDEWRKGFLAGIFDAEGSYSRGILRVCNKDPVLIARIADCFRHFGWNVAIESKPDGIQNVRVRGGLREHLRFFHTTDPAISRKRNIEGQAIKNNAELRVASIEPLNRALRLFDITTGTGDFIANGVVSHNCYARPSHEYLGFGSGVDFERRIVVKPQAPELLREAFEKKSWQGELVVVSGNTDCYQPLEASYELTRRCLQVCAEYRNPVHIITKSPLVERDIDVLGELGRNARVGVSVSVPFWDEKNARVIEPYVATPKRRIETVRRLAAAGIPVTVNVAPVIPGLTDRDIASILEAAATAGARSAAMIMLRLPGNVKQVFEARLRAKLPLAADRILARTREVRSGKLNDPRFGARMRGEGQYAEAIEQLFAKTAERLGLNAGHGAPEQPATTFRRPTDRGGQLRLFG